MPRPTGREVEAATKKFVKKMTTKVEDNQERTIPLVSSWADQGEFPDSWDLILSAASVRKQLQRTVNEIFTDVEYTYEDRIRPFFPSTSANYVNHRSEAGSVGAVLLHPNLMDGLRKPSGHLEVRVTAIPKDDEEEHIEDETQPSVVVEAEHGHLESNFQTLWHRMLKIAETEETEVRAVGIPEALKIRMITAMPPFQQAVLRSLRSKMHGVMKRHPVFHLINEPVTESHMLDRLGINLKETDAYLSGDYEAATDNIFSWVSEAVADYVGDALQLANEERALFISALTGSRFKGQPQMIGQLMGSIMSFVVLCIINAAMTRWAIELAARRVYTLRDAPLTINGDDVAAKGDKHRLPAFWETITSFVGLKKSIGKTYVSREFVNMNSTSYMRTEEPFPLIYTRKDGSQIVRPSRLKLTKYVNLGLLKGLKRAGAPAKKAEAQAGKKTPKGDLNLNEITTIGGNLGARARELLRLAPERLHEQVMREFIKHHRDVLKKTRLPWYMPDWLGGLGLPSGPWGSSSPLDRRIAMRIILHWNTVHPIPISRKGVAWKTWLRAEKALPEPVYCRTKNEHTEAYSHMVGRKCIDLLFDSSVELSDLFQELNDDKSFRVIHHNARLWSPKEGGLPKELPADAELFQPLYANFVISDPRPSLRERMESIAARQQGAVSQDLD